MTQNIVLIVDDLMFLPKLENSIRAHGYDPVVATNDTTLTRALFKAPVLIIVDLFPQTAFDWEMLVRLVKKGKGKHTPVLGFGPHVDLDLRERALAAGCDAVVGRGAIVSQLPQLIEKHRLSKSSRCDDSPPEGLMEGIRLFNEQDYYWCHEVIEDVWMEEDDSVRLMYQGILQVGVACFHIQQKNWRGAVKVMQRGLAKLHGFVPTCMGINIASIVTQGEAIQQHLTEIGPDWERDFDTSLFFKIDWQE